jgi:hypothetical protein
MQLWVGKVSFNWIASEVAAYDLAGKAEGLSRG